MVKWLKRIVVVLAVIFFLAVAATPLIIEWIEQGVIDSYEDLRQNSKH